ncbi:hypothetical protein EN837_29185, partial [bacterium M00.F.Ca.ET.194.01.1.1]
RYGLIQIPAGGSNTPFHADLDLAQTRMTITDGREVFSKAVEMMTACSRDALTAARLRPQDLDRFVPHQANARMNAMILKLSFGHDVDHDRAPM